MKHVVIEKQFSILDVGWGGGRTIEKLAALASEGVVYGVDYGAGSVAASRARNSRLNSGNCLGGRVGGCSAHPTGYISETETS